MANEYSGKSVSEIRKMVEGHVLDQIMDMRLVVNGEEPRDCSQVLKTGDILAWRNRHGRDVVEFEII